MSISSYAAYPKNLMGSAITIAPLTGRSTDGYNTPTYGTDRTYPCYVMQEYAQILNAVGQLVVSSARTHLYPVAADGTPLLALATTDRFTLPDGTRPVVLSVETQFDQFGKIVLYVVYT